MKKRIFMVDDDSHLLFAISEYLSRKGYSVECLASGSEALEKLLESPPDLIIADIMMDGMDGFEFQRRVMALTGDSIPFIFLTAKVELQDRLDGLRSGADDYITKPFEPEELEARIAAVLSRVEQTRREERREIENLRGRILAEISNRLRAPVTSLMAHMNLVLADRFDGNITEQERYLRRALEDTNVLRELIEDLSWAASLRGTRLVLKREPIRVAPVVRGSAATAAKIAAEKSIDLNITCGGLLSGNIDGSAFTRALSGLLEAAVSLSPVGSQVEIGATRASEGGIEFVITDGGYQDGNASQPSGNMADALEFARRVVDGHGGQITVERDPDGRQSFVIWVPGRVAKHVGARF